MTVIALKDNIIATDGRYTDGDEIVYDDYQKMIVRGGIPFFFTGEPAHLKMFLDCYLAGKHCIPEHHKGAVIHVVAVEEDGLYSIYTEDTKGNFVKEKLRLDAHWAMGCGRLYAITAMDLGLDAVEAVKMAIKRDTKCGGKIQAWKVIHDAEVGYGIEKIDQDLFK